MHHISSEMKACIDNCLACYQECLSTAMSHCLEMDGEHAKPDHFRLMIACSEICRT
ncbi:four-helix bundle copper-binding protein, partial [Escherichia coli]|nr:four-helix bundle copper-binding protein [Escherichia coli]